MTPSGKVNPSVSVIQAIGTPFSEKVFTIPEPSPDVVITALANRVGLIFLEAIAKLDMVEPYRQELEQFEQRYEDTQSVILEVCKTLNKIGIEKYVVFKSIKPYKATPNDTDILFLGSNAEFKAAVDGILKSGYLHLEDAPLQRTFYDPRGKGKVHSDKRGGVYYLDLYKKAGADYFVYLNSNKLLKYVQETKIDGERVPILEPGAEMGACLIHTVFPEKTYQLQDFYLVMNTVVDFSQQELDGFIHFTRTNHITRPVRANISLSAHLHNEAFGFVPDKIAYLLRSLDTDHREVRAFRKQGMETPYNFTVSLFASTFFAKLLEPSALFSLGVQCVHCLNPFFGGKALERLFARCKPGGIYHAR